MTSNAEKTSAAVIYKERQWVPWHWWLAAAFVAFLFAATVSLNRSDFVPYLAFIVVFALLGWGLYSLSSTIIHVERENDGTRWLVVKDAQLPSDIVERSIAVPKSARRNVLGPQLDPAAFLVSHQWVDELAMFVLDDETDPTPYWLVSTKNPTALLHAFLPEQAKDALKMLK